MADIQIAINYGLGIEGGHSKRIEDAGGETMWGITRWLALRYKWPVFKSMKLMPIEFAMNIYRKEFAEKLWLEKIPDQDIANELFELAIHGSTKVAIKHLQRILNAFNRYGRDWDDVKADGIMGNNTLFNLKIAIERRKLNILKGLNVVQGYRMIELAENPKRRDQVFLNGWFNARIKL